MNRLMVNVLAAALCLALASPSFAQRSGGRGGRPSARRAYSSPRQTWRRPSYPSARWKKPSYPRMGWHKYSYKKYPYWKKYPYGYKYHYKKYPYWLRYGYPQMAVPLAPSTGPGPGWEEDPEQEDGPEPGSSWQDGPEPEDDPEPDEEGDLE